MPRAAVVLLAGVALVAASGCAAPGSEETASGSPVTLHTTENPGGLRGAVLDRPYTAPDVTLTDTSGAPFDLARANVAPVTLVFFGYTHCPDVCNTVLADFAAALRRVDAGVRDKVRLVFVTTDPARDTPAVMRSFLDRFDPSYIGLTGAMRDIKAAARHLGVPLTGNHRLPGGGYEVGHGTQVIGFGPDGRAGVIWLAGTPVGDIRHDLTLLATQA